MMDKKTKIIDSQMHLGLMANVRFYQYSDEKVIELEKEYHVVKAICLHCVGFIDSVQRQKTTILALSEKFGDFIYWNLVYDPNHAEESIKSIDILKEQIFFAGVKIHPVIHGIHINDERYYPLWEYAANHDIVITSHTWSLFPDNPKQIFADPLLFEDVLYDYPDIKIVLGNEGGKKDYYQTVFEFASKYEYLYLDFSGDSIFPEAYETAIRVVGENQVLFGTDIHDGYSLSLHQRIIG